MVKKIVLEQYLYSTLLDWPKQLKLVVQHVIGLVKKTNDIYAHAIGLVKKTNAIYARAIGLVKKTNDIYAHVIGLVKKLMTFMHMLLDWSKKN